MLPARVLNITSKIVQNSPPPFDVIGRRLFFWTVSDTKSYSNTPEFQEEQIRNLAKILNKEPSGRAPGDPTNIKNRARSAPGPSLTAQGTPKRPPRPIFEYFGISSGGAHPLQNRFRTSQDTPESCKKSSKGLPRAIYVAHMHRLRNFNRFLTISFRFSTPRDLKNSGFA